MFSLCLEDSSILHRHPFLATATTANNNNNNSREILKLLPHYEVNEEYLLLARTRFEEFAILTDITFSRFRCNNNMKIFCYNTHTQAKKKLDGKYLTQEYENPKGFSASNDGDKDCISAEREGGGETERERERESVRVCVGGGCRVFSLLQVSLTSANVLLGQSSTFFDNPLYCLHFTRPPSLRGRSATAAAAVRKNRFDPMLIYLEELFICCCLVDHSSRACVHACLLLLL
jgi:hypothetical protein